MKIKNFLLCIGCICLFFNISCGGGTRGTSTGEPIHIKGSIVSPTNVPLNNIAVSVEGSSETTISDTDGMFEIEVTNTGEAFELRFEEGDFTEVLSLGIIAEESKVVVTTVVLDLDIDEVNILSISVDPPESVESKLDEDESDSDLSESNKDNLSSGDGLPDPVDEIDLPNDSGVGDSVDDVTPTRPPVSPPVFIAPGDTGDNTPGGGKPPIDKPEIDDPEDGEPFVPFKRNVVLSGTFFDIDGDYIQNVVIIVDGTFVAVKTDRTGQFSLEVETADSFLVLSVSYEGKRGFIDINEIPMSNVEINVAISLNIDVVNDEIDVQGSDEFDGINNLNDSSQIDGNVEIEDSSVSNARNMGEELLTLSPFITELSVYNR